MYKDDETTFYECKTMVDYVNDTSIVAQQLATMYFREQFHTCS